MTRETAEVLHMIVQGIADGSIISNTDDFHALIMSKIEADELRPHYEFRGSKPVWVSYQNGEEVVEPYRHQDDCYSNMCVAPNWCRCSQ